MDRQPQPALTRQRQNAYFSAHLPPHPSRQMVWKEIAAYLSRYVPPNARLLELGPGYCDLINQLPAADKVAVDLWAEVPQYAAKDVCFIQQDLSQGLGSLATSKPFDIVFASNLLEHFEPEVAGQLVREVFHILRPDGRFVVIQPNFHDAYRTYFDDYTHRSIFTHVSLPNLMRSHGFQIEQVEARFIPYSMRETALPIQPWLVRAYLRFPLKPFAGQMLVVARKPHPG